METPDVLVEPLKTSLVSNFWCLVRRIYLRAKTKISDFLESHPYGYFIGVLFIDNFDFLLPHETDFYGFQVLAQAGHFSPKTLLDLGANRGHSARAFIKLLPEWNIISVEANTLHKSRLSRIQSKFPNRFGYHIRAITDQPKKDLKFYTPFYRALALHSASALSPEEALLGAELAFPRLKGKFFLEEVTTPTASVDGLGLDASFIKMDVQGEEMNALRGMTELLERRRPVILAETTLDTDKSLRNLLASLDYEAWLFSVEDMFFYRASDDARPEGLSANKNRNHFFFHKDRLPPSSVIKHILY